MEMALPSVQK
jgi:pre-mRNA-processing factor 8